MFDRALPATVRWFLYCGAFFLLAMIAYTTVDVLSRALFKAPLPVAYEMSEQLAMVLIVGSGLAAVSHVRVDLAVGRLKGRVRLIVELLNAVVGCVLVALMVWQCMLMALSSLAERERAAANMPFPIYPARIGLALGLALLLLVLIAALVRLARSGKIEESTIDDIVN